MLFSPWKATQNFQCFVDKHVRDLDFVYAYIDGLLIASSSKDCNLADLETLFNCLSEYGTVINPGL